MLDCTVMLIQYNPEKNKLMRTIRSITMQKDIHAQIVIADDGSVNDCFDDIDAYLKSANYEDYCFSKNKNNQGTVYNIWNALKFAKNRYISFISPGDYYYDELTLQTAIETMVNEEYQLLFGRISPFRWENGKLSLINRQMPYDHLPYIKYMQTGNDRIIRRNMIVYRDAVIGASCYWEKDLFESYLKEIVGKVKYMEDAVCINAVIDRVRMCFLNRYVVWYEFGTGLSTKLAKKSREIINADDNAYFKLLIQKYPDLDVIQRRKILNRFDGLKGYKLFLLKVILFPDRFLYIIFHYLLFKEKMPLQDTRFINGLYTEGDI